MLQVSMPTNVHNTYVKVVNGVQTPRKALPNPSSENQSV